MPYHYWPPLRRKRQTDYLSRVIFMFPVAASLLSNLNTADIVNLLNTSSNIRRQILESHFNSLREIVLVRDHEYHLAFDPAEELVEPPTQKHGQFEGNFDPDDLFFLRFNELSFDELILKKILQLPAHIHPTLDRPFDNNHRFITKLVLDGTDVGATALFGSFSIGQGVSNLPVRLTPGLISYLAIHLEHLSMCHCPNINHSQVCVYLLMPPTDDTALRKLRRLKVFNSGENPANGPFHNKQGFGSHGKVAKEAEHILSLQLLRILFPVKIPYSHHHKFTLEAIIPFNLSTDLRRQMKAALHNQLVAQFGAGWFAKANVFLDPMLTLCHPNNGQFVSGPWGGKLSKIHESIALYSTCRFLRISLDWGLCINASKCYSFRLQHYQNIASIDNKTGRLHEMGYMNGMNARRFAGSHTPWWSQSQHPLPRLPQTLLPPYLPITAAHMRDANPRPINISESKLPQAQRVPEPAYYNVDGQLVIPMSDDPNRPPTSLIYGLQSSGNHSHCASGVDQRELRGGPPCSNCGIRETEDCSILLEDGSLKLNPGRGFPVGEICSICVKRQTCSICDKFYCSNCLDLNPDLSTGPMLNPFAREMPDPDFIVPTCNIHGVICSTCRDTGEAITCTCGKYFCQDCMYDDCMEEVWECCRVCNEWFCETCNQAMGTKEGGLEECAGVDCASDFGGYHPRGKRQGICNGCIGGKCKKCYGVFCHTCFDAYQTAMKDQHGLEVVPSDDGILLWVHCTDCFERRLSNCASVEERNDAIRALGVNPYVLERQQRLSKDWISNRESLIGEFAAFQNAEMEYYRKCLYGGVTMEQVKSANRKTQLRAVSSKDEPVILYGGRVEPNLQNSASPNVVRHTMERLLWMLKSTPDLNLKQKTELIKNLSAMRDRFYNEEKRRLLDAKEYHKAAASKIVYDPKGKSVDGTTRAYPLNPVQPSDPDFITESDAELDEFMDDFFNFPNEQRDEETVVEGMLSPRRSSYAIGAPLNHRLSSGFPEDRFDYQDYAGAPNIGTTLGGPTAFDAARRASEPVQQGGPNGRPNVSTNFLMAVDNRFASSFTYGTGPSGSRRSSHQEDTASTNAMQQSMNGTGSGRQRSSFEQHSRTDSTDSTATALGGVRLGGGLPARQQQQQQHQNGDYISDMEMDSEEE